jgi:AraC-type DNA-binding domain-containing proteins
MVIIMAYEYEFINHMKGTFFNTFLISINRRLYHWHSDIELLLVIEGSVIVNTPENEYLLNKDDLFLLNSNKVHSLARTKENNTLIAIQFDPKLSKTYFPKLQRIRFLNKLIDKNDYPECSKVVKKCLLDFVADYYKKDNGYEFKLMSTLNMIIYYLLKYVPYEEVVEYILFAEQKNLERLSRIIDYIHDNYMHKISLKNLAASENMDMYYMSHLIKKQLGISFQEYLNKKRLEKSVELLTQTNWRNIDVCIESGFSDYRYLCKAFIKEYGCTPSNYKLQYKELKPVISASDTEEQQRFIDQYEALEKLILYTAE